VAGYADWLRSRVGTEFFVTDWQVISQPEVDSFANLTRDWDYMHNDPIRAAGGPWRGTIVHGYLLVSLISQLMGQAGFPMLETEHELMLNYGLDRVRFIEPVMVGDRVRARLSLTDMQHRREGVELAKVRVTYETERAGAKPNMVADVLMLVVSGQAVKEPR
jgi:acyl dehydratase